MICKSDECTGCFGCFNICPKNAIEMKKDDFGNIYPEINTKKCINCGLCRKVCPSLNQNKINYNIPQKIYAMYSKDNDIRNKSTSGGVATTISKYFIENNGIVYGASNLFNNNTFDFCRIDSIDDLYKIQGSKYVHCYIKDSFRKVKEDLINKKDVLFIGTPCQVSGLKMFLQKDYENLVTIDIICHGVPSQKLLFEDIKNKYKLDKLDYEYITFRDSNGYHLKIYKTIEDYKNGKAIISNFANLDLYFKNFLRGNIFRENCYNCNYARKERVSDITIGDFWGLNRTSKIYDDETKGISAVIVTSERGLKLIETILPLFKYEERKYDEVYMYNGQLNNPMKKKKQYFIYKNNYVSKGFRKTFKKMNLPKDYLKYNSVIYSIFKREK